MIYKRYIYDLYIIYISRTRIYSYNSQLTRVIMIEIMTDVILFMY